MAVHICYSRYENLNFETIFFGISVKFRKNWWRKCSGKYLFTSHFLKNDRQTLYFLEILHITLTFSIENGPNSTLKNSIRGKEWVDNFNISLAAVDKRPFWEIFIVWDCWVFEKLRFFQILDLNIWVSCFTKMAVGSNPRGGDDFFHFFFNHDLQVFVKNAWPWWGSNSRPLVY